MSNHTSAEAEAHDLYAADYSEPGHVAVIGLRGVIFALLDVADAIREQTTALTGDDKRAILIERNQ